MSIGQPRPGLPNPPTMKAVIWHLMMVIWLAGWLFAIWWIWPRIERLELSGELAVALVWLLIGALAWIVAFNMGRQRYWRR